MGERTRGRFTRDADGTLRVSYPARARLDARPRMERATDVECRVRYDDGGTSWSTGAPITPGYWLFVVPQDRHGDGPPVERARTGRRILIIPCNAPDEALRERAEAHLVATAERHASTFCEDCGYELT